MAAIIEQAIAMLTKPAMLPWMRTRNTTIAKAKDTTRIISEISVPLTPLPASSVNRDTGALRSRFHRPRSRSSRMPVASSMPANSANWIPMPAKECA